MAEGEVGLLRLALSDAATLYESSQVATQEVENLQLEQPRDSWQTTGVTAEYVEGDMGTTVPIDAVGLLFGNFRSATTGRVRLASSQANLTNGSALYDSTVAAMWPSGDPEDFESGERHWVHVLASAVNARWWRIDAADAAHPDGYFRFGRVGVGQLLRVKAQTPFAAIVHQEPEDRERTTGGGIFYRRVGARPLLPPISFRLLSSAIKDLRDLLMRVGAAEPVVLLSDVDATSDEQQRGCIYGLVSTMESSSIPVRNLIELRFGIQGL